MRLSACAYVTVHEHARKTYWSAHGKHMSMDGCAHMCARMSAGDIYVCPPIVQTIHLQLLTSANPGIQDRWGGTPMDDCVRGGTTRHWQCAKLLQCWGGKLGTFLHKPEGTAALSEINAVDILDVRKAIKGLIGQGLDTKKPQRASHHDCLVAMDASVELMTTVDDARRVFQVSCLRPRLRTGHCAAPMSNAAPERYCAQCFMLCQRA
jgi:hypothetical protein